MLVLQCLIQALLIILWNNNHSTAVVDLLISKDETEVLTKDLQTRQISSN